MNKNRGFTPLAAVLMLSGSLALTGCNDKETQQSAPQAPEVGVVTLKSAPLQITTELPGRTSAYRIAEVRPQVSGIILKRNFEEGSEIKAGVSLYQIDPATYQARLRQRERRPGQSAGQRQYRSGDAEALSETAGHEIHQPTGL